jgi:hypothetical protein
MRCCGQLTTCEGSEITSDFRPPAPVEKAIDLLDLTSRGADLFAVQPPHERQGFLRLVLKTASWSDGRLHTEFEEPFESLKRSNHASHSKLMEVAMENHGFEDWLPKKRTFQLFLLPGVAGGSLTSQKEWWPLLFRFVNYAVYRT